MFKIDRLGNAWGHKDGQDESLVQLNGSPLCPHSAGDSQRTGQEEKGKQTRPSTSDGINNTVSAAGGVPANPVAL